MQTNDNDDDDNGACDAARSTIPEQNLTRFPMVVAPRRAWYKVSTSKQKKQGGKESDAAAKETTEARRRR